MTRPDSKGLESFCLPVALATITVGGGLVLGLVWLLAAFDESGVIS